MAIFDKLRNILNNKTSKKERTTLETWKNEAESNIDAINKMIEAQVFSEILGGYHDVDVDRGWLQVESGIDDGQITQPSFNYRKIAAIFVIIFIGLGGIYLINKADADTQEMMVYNGSQTTEVSYKDGSLFTLDDTSVLTEESYRNFSLLGRAYFNVAPDAKNPFIIATKYGEITVLGTEFNVIATDYSSEVFVNQGRVQVNFNGTQFILNKGDLLTLSDQGTEQSTDPDILPDLWLHKVLTFENKSLNYLLKTIASYYQIEIEIPSTLENDSCKLNTKFDNESLQSILDELGIIAGLKYEKAGKYKIVIKSFKC